MKDYIMCELIDGGSPRHLNSFSNLSIIAVHYTRQSTLCNVAIVDYNPLYVMLLLLTIIHSM